MAIVLSLVVPNAAQAASFADDIQYAQSVAIVRANHNDTAVTDVSRRYTTFDWGNPANNSCMHLSASYALRTAEAVSLYKRYPDSKLNGMQYFDTVQIIWTTAADPVSQITFEDALGPYGFKQLLASQTYMVQLQIDTDGRLVVRDCSEPPYSSSPAIWFADGRQIMQLVYARGYTIQYPIDFVGIPVPTKVPNARYVAMGDSFSSGEGNDPFEAGTDINDVNKCHRSSYAYPRWLAQTPSLNLESFSFVACSGATTTDVLYGGTGEGNWNEGPQIDALSADAEVVTITIGGNDIRFKDFATQCGLGSCDSTTAIYSTTMAMIHNELPAKLEDVLNKISIKTDSAKVFVVGYPYVTPEPGVNGLPYQCNYLDSANGSGLDSLAARDIVAELNDTINDATAGFVNMISSTSFVFVDPNSSLGGTFDGHDICQGTDSYFHNVTPNDYFGNGYREKIFHPNVDGQHEYYEIIKDTIETN